MGTDSEAAPTPDEARASDEAQAATLPAPSSSSLPYAPVPATFHDLSERQLKNPSEMLAKPGLLFRLVGRLLFQHASFEERHVATIREATREGSVVFVMGRRSLLDYLYFNYAFLRFGLPLVFFANQITTTLFRPFWRNIVRRIAGLFRRRGRRLQDTELLAYGIEQGRHALIFLKNRKRWPWTSSEVAPDNAFLRTVVAAQLERIHACEGDPDCRPEPIRVIPQLLIWTQDPDRYERSLWDRILGDPSAPTRLRKLISFAVNRHRVFVRLGEVIDVAAFIESQPEGATVDELARKLRFTIHKSMSVEERVIKGPILKDAKRIREEILRTREMQREVARLATAAGKGPARMERRIRRYLKEIAADFSIEYLEFLAMVMTFVFRRIYSEIVPDEEGLDRVREAARKAPIILLPCHRSHVDYLVISYLFYASGLMAPHIAAGANLSFFPLGPIFRGSGAFFLRRSFKDNEPYQVAFREYLRKLVKEGYWIEFFIEGGRSRTGKMMPPRYGLLGQVIDAIRGGAAPDVYFAPIYLGYEQIIEEQAYTSELTGGEKRKESITELLKTTQVLWSRYGRLYVNFAEPFSCRELIEAHEQAARERDPDAEPDWQYFVRQVAFRALHAMNEVAPLTPSAVTAAALLMHPKRGVSRDVLLGRVGFIMELAGVKRAPLSQSLEHALRIRRQEVASAAEAMEESGERPWALALGDGSPLARARGAAVVEVIDEVLQRFVAQKLLERHVFEGRSEGPSDDDEVVYTPVPDKRVNLDFYKNNIVHLFVREAIFAVALRSVAVDGRARLEEVREQASFLSSTFKFEFVYDPRAGFEDTFEATRGDLVRWGMVDEAEGEGGAVLLEVSERAADTVLLLHQLLEPWLEAYWLAVLGLEPVFQGPTSEKELVRQIQRRGRRAFQEGDLSCLEAASSVTFKNALASCEAMGLIERARKGRESVVSLAPLAAEEPARMSELARRLRRCFNSPS